MGVSSFGVDYDLLRFAEIFDHNAHTFASTEGQNIHKFIDLFLFVDF
jgi:hypothetical protein